MIEPKKYLMSDGKVYEIDCYDDFGRPVCRLTDLKEIPEDKPLKKAEVKEEEVKEEAPEVKPRRRRKVE